MLQNINQKLRSLYEANTAFLCFFMSFRTSVETKKNRITAEFISNYAVLFYYADNRT